MGSVVSIKIITALCYPIGLASLLLLLWAIARLLKMSRSAGFFATLGMSIMLLASNPVFARWLLGTLENQYPQQSLHDIVEHDAILVLGGGLRLPIAPAKHPQLSSGSDRYLYALRLYRAGLAERIILSGGNMFPQRGLEGEAFYASKLLQSWGVPREVIAVETTSRTTIENHDNVLELLKSHDIKTALLVTSAYHMPRAYAIFKESPVSITPASADILLTDYSVPGLLNWVPSAGALQLTTTALHEYYGMAFSSLKARSLRDS